VSVILSAWVALTVLLCASCGGSKNESDYKSYLGDYSYDSPIIAMVYEDLDGEGSGVLYREVLDYTSYVTKSPLPVLVYFYTSLHTDYVGTTAQVEQIAEDLQGQITVVSVNVFQEGKIAEHYGIVTVPEFVILREGLIDDRFDSAERGTWTEDELIEWVSEALSKQT
jgi:thioredoxin 1